MPIVTSDIIATTLPKYAGKIERNLPRLSPVLTQVAKRGNAQQIGVSGTEFRIALEYNLNNNIQFYAAAEVFRTDRQEILTHAAYMVRQLVGTVTMEGIEEAINDGPEAVHNLAKAKIKNLERSLQQIVAETAYYDGTEHGGKAFAGLKAFYTATPAVGVTGGVDRATAVDNRGRYWWRNKVMSIGADGAIDPPAIPVGAPSTRPVVRAILHQHVQVKNNADMPDLMVMPDDHYLKYMEEVMEKQMITTTAKERAGYGFNGVVFGFAPSLDVVNDAVAPSGRSYMLNTEYIHQRKAKGNWMRQLPKARPVNQDVTVESTIAYGNTCASNLERAGVLVD